MAFVILLWVSLGMRGSVSHAVCPPGQPHGGGSAQILLSATPSPGSPSPTLLWVSLALGDTGSAVGLDGLSDTEWGRGSPPFSWGEQGGTLSSSPGA